MKKFLAVLISLLMIISLAACVQSDLPDVDILTDEEIDSALAQFDRETADEAASPEREPAPESLPPSKSENGAPPPAEASAPSGKPAPLVPEEDLASYSASSGISSPAPDDLRPNEQLGGLDSESESILGSIVSPFLVSNEIIQAGIKANGNPPAKRPSEYICTISVSCTTAISAGVNLLPGFTHLPSSGWILPPTEVTFRAGESAFEVLAKTVIEKGIHMEYSGAGGLQYIEGIDNLYEFDGGRWSGWMYCVNNWYPNFGCGQYPVERGDVIELNYTCDLGKDLGQEFLSE